MPSAIDILTSRRAAQQRAVLTSMGQPGEEETDPIELLKQVGGYGLTAIGAVGNAMDLPGSVVRDLAATVATGRFVNPVDQFLSPFSSENRTTGRDLMTHVGFRANRESSLSDWARDPGEAAMDIGGFITEVVMDPFNPAKWALGGVGGISKKLSKATSQTVKSAGALASRLPVVGRPLAGATRVARDHANRMFNYARGGVSEDAAKYVEPLVKRTIADERKIHAMGLDVAESMRKAGWDMSLESPDGIANARSFRAWLSGDEAYQAAIAADPSLKAIPPEVLSGPAGNLPLQYRKLMGEAAASGLRVADLYDPLGGAEYAARYMGDEVKEYIRSSSQSWGGLWNTVKSFTTRSGQAAAREHVYKGIKGADEVLNKILTDTEFKSAIDEVVAYTTKNLVKDSLVGQAANTVMPRHLDALAERLDTTSTKLWEQLGLDPAKPYASASDVLPRIDKMKADLDAAVLRGDDVPSRYHQVAGKFIYTNILTGKGKRVKIVKGAFQDLPAGQTARHLKGASVDPDDLKMIDAVRAELLTRLSHAEDAWGSHVANTDTFLKNAEGDEKAIRGFEKLGERLKRQAEAAAEAPLRFEQALAHPHVGVFTWKDASGADQFFAPKLVSELHAGWKRTRQAIQNGADNAPASELEMAHGVTRHILEKKYGHLVDDRMPMVDASGRYRYRTVDADGNTLDTFAFDSKTAKQLDTDLAAKARRLERYKAENDLVTDLVPEYNSRLDALSLIIATRPNLRAAGLFTNNPIVDFVDHAVFRKKQIRVADTLAQLATDSFIQHSYNPSVKRVAPKRLQTIAGQGPVGPPLKEILQNEGPLDSVAFVERIRKDLLRQGKLQKVVVPLKPADTASKAVKAAYRRGVNEYKKALKQQRDAILDTPIDAELASHIEAAFATPSRMEDTAGLKTLFSAATNITKSGLLSTPRTVFRDSLSAFAMGALMGDIKMTSKGLTRVKDAFSLAKGGRASLDIPLTPSLETHMRSIGLDPADLAQREQAFVSMYAAHANRINTHSSPMADDTLRSRSGKADILNEARPQGMGQSIKQALSDNIVKDLATGKVSLLHSAWNMVNPLRTRGSLRKESGKWVQSGKNNMIAATAGAVREHMDNTVRMGSILNLMDDGMDFTQAFDRVAWHQVNYDRRFFTKFEQRWAKTIFPFYSFVSRSIPMVAMELATNPGGPLGRVIRAQRIAQSGDDYVPYDLQDSAAIPLGKNEEGDLRYITNLGLMHEEAVRYLGAPVTGVRPLLQKIIGSSSPFVKGIVEYGMNTSTFFDGPMGGRRLDDLDPSIGRILANIGLREIPPSGRPEPFGGPMVEAMAANSPLAAALSYLKVMTEGRDRRGLREKAVNLLTGLRTRQITPEMLSRELRDRLNAEQVKLGARPVTIVSGTKGLSQRYSETGSDEEVAKLAMLERALAIVRKQAEERSERRAGGGK